jgi:hypothetical protein
MQVRKIPASLWSICIDGACIVRTEEWARTTLDVRITIPRFSNIPPNKLLRCNTQTTRTTTDILCRNGNFIAPTTVATVKTVNPLKCDICHGCHFLIKRIIGQWQRLFNVLPIILITGCLCAGITPESNQINLWQCLTTS